MFNKLSWNNRRGGYLKPPDQEEQERKQELVDAMKDTVSKKKEDSVQKISLTELAQQKHYDLDASIAQEVKKQAAIQPLPEVKIKPVSPPMTNIAVLQHVKEQVEEESSLQPIYEFAKALDTVLAFLDSANTNMLVLQESVRQADVETSDLLHSIELTDFEENEKSEMTDKLKEVRIRRRIQKRQLEYYTETDAYVTSNKTAIGALKTLKGKIRRITEKQETATYRPRIRTDLKANTRIQA